MLCLPPPTPSVPCALLLDCCLFVAASSSPLRGRSFCSAAVARHAPCRISAGPREAEVGPSTAHPVAPARSHSAPTCRFPAAAL
uniref:Secreted protein n=1 Tax=Setaria viridis TaxID=4556 RepID=A0A4U6USC1_SETVI|nr:hypothetical protein SEVIR_5G369350v2 [Setaria viridis]